VLHAVHRLAAVVMVVLGHRSGGGRSGRGRGGGGRILGERGAAQQRGAQGEHQGNAVARLHRTASMVVGDGLCSGDPTPELCRSSAPGAPAAAAEADFAPVGPQSGTPSFLCTAGLVVVYCRCTFSFGNSWCLMAKAASAPSWKPERISFFLPG